MSGEVLLATRNRAFSTSLRQSLSGRGVRFASATAPNDFDKFVEKRSKKPSLLLIDDDVINHYKRGYEWDKFLFSVERFKRELPIFYIFNFGRKKTVERELFTNLDVHQIFTYRRNIKEIENEVVQAVLDIVKHDTDKRFESVSYLEEGDVFACTFMNGHKFFLDRQLIQEDDGSKVENISIEPDGYSFSVSLASGKEYEIPWDFVRYHCDIKYRESVKAVKPFSTVAERIKEIRVSSGKTQEELSRATGIKRPNIARIESGKHEPSLETLKKLADALDVSVADFFLTWYNKYAPR